jgi:hypothetical protein
MVSLFGRPAPTVKDQCRAWTSSLNREVRGLDREIKSENTTFESNNRNGQTTHSIPFHCCIELQQEQEKMKIEMKKAGKQPLI